MSTLYPIGGTGRAGKMGGVKVPTARDTMNMGRVLVYHRRPGKRLSLLFCETLFFLHWPTLPLLFGAKRDRVHIYESNLSGRICPQLVLSFYNSAFLARY